MPKNKAKSARAARQLEIRRRNRSAGEDRQAASPSRPNAPEPSPWHQQPAGRREALEAADQFTPLRNKLREIARFKDEWAGIPMPLDGEQLVIEPRYPFAGLSQIGKPDEVAEKDDELAGAKIRNQFWSSHKRSTIIVFEKSDGRIDWGLSPGANHLTHDLRTMGCAEAWGIEQESNALATLGTMLPHRRFKQYLLTGMFLETSKRSGVTYLFRRLKPTVAIHTVKGHLRILCALCLHPIAYYAGSWAGAMTPTDDVIAHLALMRGDEAMFWRRANQHPAWTPEAGV